MPPYFLAGATTKKNKPLIAARIAEEKEKDRLKDLRRDTRRRQWALALADILARRNGLPIKGVELVFKLDDDKHRYLAQQVKKELGLSENLNGAALRHKVEDILRRWPAGIGSSPSTFYHHLAAQGQVRDALAFDCMRTAFLTRCIAGLGWCYYLTPSALRTVLIPGRITPPPTFAPAGYGSRYVTRQ